MNAKPFLKWAGGKRQLLPELLKRVPATFGAYHEPFLGGGSLFFALAPPVAFLGDVNADLIAAYTEVRSNAERLICRLQEFAASHDKENYYLARSWVAGSHLDQAARMIYLNKTCFNGLWRVNKAGKFNVPMGDIKAPAICDADTLRACSEVLRGGNVRVWQESFEASDRARAGDFVYFDPPYVPLSKTSNFTGYAGAFGMREQERLRDLALTLKRRGVHVLLSNSGAPEVANLYAGSFEISEIAARRGINSKASKRGPVMEYLIT